MKEYLHTRIILVALAISTFSCVDQQTNVRCVSGLPRAIENNTNNAFNRQPLQANCMAKLPLGSVHAKGWLLGQLTIEANGMTGHISEVSPFMKPDNGWLGGDKDGWEEQAYWFRGFYDLSVLTGDPRLQAEAQKWIEAIIVTQDADGYFGPKNQKCVVGKDGKKVCDLWPHMVMMEPLIAHYEATGDERILKLFERFYQFCKNLPDEQFISVTWADVPGFGDWRPAIQATRAADMVSSIVWYYNQTGEKWLVDLAYRFFRRTTGPDGTFVSNHVIDFTQRFAYPGIFSQVSKQAWQLDLSEYWYKQHMTVWGQTPRGIFGADEIVRPGYTDPRQGFETCGFGEFTRSFYQLARITGKPMYADRSEDLLFNHFPASQTPDMKGLHYITASNQPQLDAGEKHDFTNKYRQVSYSPYEIYRCCEHNVAMTWPRFTENLWQASADNGLVAFMYAPNEVKTKVGSNNSEITIETVTDYPFKGKLAMSLSCQDAVEFPLYLRIPVWAKGASVSLNGKALNAETVAGEYLCIDRTWKGGDKLEMNFPMELKLAQWPRTGAVTVDRGPLSYSVKIGERWHKHGGTDQWPEMEVFPTTDWNYGLVIADGDLSNSFKVEETAGVLAAQPFTPETAPIHIRAKARKIANWQIDPETQTVPDLQSSPITSAEPEEEITLIPLGCARLRMACLPVIGQGPDASEWQLKPVILRK